MKIKSIAASALAALALGTTGSLALAIQPAAAAVITSLPEGTKQEFTLHSRSISTPVTFGDGVTYKATNLAGVQRSTYFG